MPVPFGDLTSLPTFLLLIILANSKSVANFVRVHRSTGLRHRQSIGLLYKSVEGRWQKHNEKAFIRADS